MNSSSIISKAMKIAQEIREEYPNATKWAIRIDTFTGIVDVRPDTGKIGYQPIESLELAATLVAELTS